MFLNRASHHSQALRRTVELLPVGTIRQMFTVLSAPPVAKMFYRFGSGQQSTVMMGLRSLCATSDNLVEVT